MCRTAKLTYEDMEMMTIGMCMDYIDEYNELHTPKEEKEKVVEYADEISWL